MGIPAEALAPIELEAGGRLRARLIGLGATLMALDLRRSDGSMQPLVLGFDEPARYAEPHPYFGSTVGRVANRIRDGRLTLAGRTYALERNDGRHHLHGGLAGFHCQPFAAETFASDGEAGVSFTRVSPAGEGGYPGRLEVRVTYRLDRADALRIDFEARSDALTAVNLTHHSAFNLRDGGASDVFGHALEVAAEQVLAVDIEGIPTGQVLPVAGTRFDFTAPHALQAGVDHCLLLARTDGALRHAATLSEPTSGLRLQVATTQPALQVYTGSFLDGTLVGRGGVRYAKHAGVCLETQHPVGAPVLLGPGERYAETVVYRLA
jgi:aldose 1-epimerase